MTVTNLGAVGADGTAVDPVAPDPVGVAARRRRSRFVANPKAASGLALLSVFVLFAIIVLLTLLQRFILRDRDAAPRARRTAVTK